MRLVRLLALVLTLGLLSTSALALPSKIFTLAELISRSDALVRGRVEASEAAWNAAGDRIYTDWTVRVSEAVFGAARGQVLKVRQMGGRVGEVTQRVSGNASVALGEEVVLFLKTDGSFHYIAAMAQGKWSVVGDAGAERLVRVPAADGAVPKGAPRWSQWLREIQRVRQEVAP